MSTTRISPAARSFFSALFAWFRNFALRAARYAPNVGGSGRGYDAGPYLARPVFEQCSERVLVEELPEPQAIPTHPHTRQRVEERVDDVGTAVAQEQIA